MKITREEVLHVARLAELAVAEVDLDNLTSQLDHIVAYVGQLEAVPQGPDASPFHPGPGAVLLRADVVAPVPLAHGPGEMAPAMRHGFFVVPRLGAQEDA